MYVFLRLMYFSSTYDLSSGRNGYNVGYNNNGYYGCNWHYVYFHEEINTHFWFSMKHLFVCLFFYPTKPVSLFDASGFKLAE